MMLLSLRWFSGISHVIYGVLALVMPFYIEEFVRYGFGDYRVLISLSQGIGGLGLLAGFYSRKLTLVSAGLLSIMMLSAVLTRVVIQDEFIKTAPAIAYFLINSFIFIKSLKQIK